MNRNRSRREGGLPAGGSQRKEYVRYGRRGRRKIRRQQAKFSATFGVERVVLGVGCVVVTGRRVLLWCVVKERFPRVDLSSWGVYAGRSVQISADEEF